VVRVSDEKRCASARQFELIDQAFRKGDLDALRAAAEDPSIVPNGRMPDGIGPCLTYAIYHSPLPFIRTLLEIGANPNVPADDGFPPLIAALSTGREVAGATKRTDVDAVIRLLLSFGADPNQRGINDYTPLHMAVGERNAYALQLLLDVGADREARVSRTTAKR
jgi:ankyrin repeat protein